MVNCLPSFVRTWVMTRPRALPVMFDRAPSLATLTILPPIPIPRLTLSRDKISVRRQRRSSSPS